MNVGATDELRGRRVTLIPAIAGHIEQLLRIRYTPEVEARWGHAPEAADWPFDEPGIAPFTVMLNGAIVGFIQPYLLAAERDYLKQNTFKLAYLDFDWKLNDRAGIRH